MDCQLRDMDSIVINQSVLQNMSQIRIRISWWAKKRVVYIMNKILRRWLNDNNKSIADRNTQHFSPGDLVSVRSKAEIEQLLDDWGAWKGCIFAPEMYASCGKTLRVIKNVCYFYDEVKERMCKSRNMVFLEDSTCSGQRKAFPHNCSCDRQCFYFWHTSWLRKENEQDKEKINTGCIFQKVGEAVM